MAKRVAKLFGLGGTGAAAGIYGIKWFGFSAVGLVGSGVGWGTSAIFLGATGGGLLMLAGYGAYRCLRR